MCRRPQGILLSSLCWALQLPSSGPGVAGVGTHIPHGTTADSKPQPRASGTQHAPTHLTLLGTPLHSGNSPQFTLGVKATNEMPKTCSTPLWVADPPGELWLSRSTCQLSRQSEYGHLSTIKTTEVWRENAQGKKLEPQLPPAWVLGNRHPQRHPTVSTSLRGGGERGSQRLGRGAGTQGRWTDSQGFQRENALRSCFILASPKHRSWVWAGECQALQASALGSATLPAGRMELEGVGRGFQNSLSGENMT